MGEMSEWVADKQYLEYLRGLLAAACTVHDTAQQRKITKALSSLLRRLML